MIETHVINVKIACTEHRLTSDDCRSNLIVYISEAARYRLGRETIDDAYRGSSPPPPLTDTHRDSQDTLSLEIGKITHFNLPPSGLFLYPPQSGEGVGSDPPPPRCISKTDGRRKTDEAAFERSRQDASKPLSKFKIEVTCQVKGQNRVFSGCRP